MKIVFLLSLSIVLYSCTQKTAITNDQKADTLVKHFLDSTLNDPKSYEAVKFEKMDTIMTDYTDDSSFALLDANVILQRSRDLVNNFDLYQQRIANGYYDKMDKAAKDSLEKVYKPKVKWYHVQHSFRAKNAFNALILHTMGFNIDTGITKILYAYELKD